MGETARQRLVRLVATHGGDGTWFVASNGTRFGDLHIALSQIEAFRRIHAGSARIVCLAVNGRHAAVAETFPALDAVHLVPELGHVLPADFHAFNAQDGRSPFGPGRVMLLLPSMYQIGGFVLDQLSSPPIGASHADFVRVALRLPLNSQATPPPPDPDLTREAAALAEQAGMIPGRAVILFPYAQSFPQDWSAHYLRLAADLADDGMQVFTSVAPGEEAVPGSRPLSFSFRVLRPLVTLAGYSVTARSGIGDMLADLPGRNVVLYPDLLLHRYWALRNMGVRTLACELVVNPREADPAAFSTAVRLALARPGQSPDPYRYPFSGLFEHPRLGRLALEEALGRQAMVFRDRYFAVFPGVALGDSWDIEDWGAWSVGRFADIYVNTAPLREHGDAAVVLLECWSAISVRHPELRIAIRLNGEAVLRHSFRHPDASAATLRVPIPPDCLAQPFLRLVLEVENPLSPAEQQPEKYKDLRLLGVALVKLRSAAAE